LVCLPTGDGKSYVFQLLASIGYGANDGLPGVTLVITPTVALAMDHERAAKELGISGHRMAYFGGIPSEERRDMINRIRNGTQGLCFASPEAACGLLRPALIDAAKAGMFRTFVLDEAHLVDAWGANFRAAFQVLSGLRAEFMKVAPTPSKPRTLLLSATLTAATIGTLKTLFPGDLPGDTGFGLVTAAQLRPEIDYWVAGPVRAAERERRVVEAILHMPRPAILYVTEVAHAKKWHRELRKLGFSRLSVMTGDTSPQEKTKIVLDWHEGRLDLVVGTSAFGLGIDNPHVRTVIHACVPETLDRFYQEVGRGGRDGHSAASIIIPAGNYSPEWKDDYYTARGLNNVRLLKIETAHRRWSGMFKRQALFEGDDVFRMRVDGRPGLESEYIDMIGEKNTEWNVRVLTLMANAGMIELLGPDSNVVGAGDMEDPEVDGEAVDADSVRLIEQFQRIKITQPGHLDIAKWQELVEPHREKVDAAHRDNLDRMFGFLDMKECAADTLAPVYRLSWAADANEAPVSLEVAIACGGCPNCRALGRRRETQLTQNARHPWSMVRPLLSPASELVDAGNRVVIYYSNQLNSRALRRWTEALAVLVSSGVHNLITLPGAPIVPEAVQDKVKGIALFSANCLPPRDYLPPGPTMVIVPANCLLTERLLRRREFGDEHFIFVPREADYPDMPCIPLRSRFEGSEFANLDIFIQQVNS
jgi:superfamily II DNA/RNA helicase